MALDRTWYNTLVDDDGSNTVGTLWNKAAVDSLMDAVDASIVTLDATDATKAPLASPALTGVPTAPTASVGTNTTQLATTAFVAAFAQTGSWTPTIGGSTSQSGQAYSSQVGLYVKIGTLVHVQGSITVSTLGTITGNVQIKGLPYAAVTSTARAAVAIGYSANLTTSVVALTGYIAAGDSAITLTMRTAASTAVAFVAQANLSATTDLVFSMTYITT